MSEPRKIVIVGAGLAGATAAGKLRDHGYAGEVLLLGSDTHPPYELPPLSKGLLLGNTDEPDWVHDAGFYEEDAGFYEEKEIEYRPGATATRIELGTRLALDDVAGEHRFDRLVLATGSQARPLPVPGGDLPGLHTLRTLDDALALRSAFKGARRVVIVGAGWIGTEAAAAAGEHGADVTVVDQVASPLLAVLGEQVSGVFKDLHAEHGVHWRLGEGVAGFTGGLDGVTGVRLRNGDELPADVVLVAVGAAPRVDLAHAAGLELSDDGGVCADAGLRLPTCTRSATSPRISIPATGNASVWSTGRTRSGRASTSPGTCSGRTSRTCGARISFRTSTTWAANTAVSPTPRATNSSSAGISRRGTSRRSGYGTGR